MKNRPIRIHHNQQITNNHIVMIVVIVAFIKIDLALVLWILLVHVHVIAINGLIRKTSFDQNPNFT
jgi:hypothetical protein